MDQMLSRKGQRLSQFTLVFVFLSVILYFAFIQLLSPVLYGVDGYYHVAVSNFIKDFGPHYQFRWNQFSTFKDSFSDKEFLFHLFIIPFLYLSDNIISSGKYAAIFFNILFIITYIFILKRYLPNFLVACFLLLPLLSLTFTSCSLYLRPATLANVFIILIIFFLINKKWLYIFFLSLFYPLVHLTFLITVFLALLCEIIRYYYRKEFFVRNFYIVIIGCLLGYFIHPNYPHNSLSIYLNGILVPFYIITDAGLDVGREFYSAATRTILVSEFAIFFSLNIILWSVFFRKTKLSFPTLVWWGCTSFWLLLSFISNRFWYQTNVLFFIFFASYLKDWLGERSWTQVLPKINFFLLSYAVAIYIAMPINMQDLEKSLRKFTEYNLHYENVAHFMRINIPAGETIYHASWSDSPYFICLNPKDNYFVSLDPIYMLYYCPEEYYIYRNLREGKVEKPYKVLKEVFRARYGYTNKNFLLYYQIQEDHTHFKIIYRDNQGIVFQIL